MPTSASETCDLVASNKITLSKADVGLFNAGFQRRIWGVFTVLYPQDNFFEKLMAPILMITPKIYPFKYLLSRRVTRYI